LLPHITADDIIALFDKQNGNADAGSEDVVDGDGDGKSLSVRQREALLSGLIHTDTPCATLSFLLAPRFLSTDRARVAVYAIARYADDDNGMRCRC
jgi:hypothetical protein